MLTLRFMRPSTPEPIVSPPVFGASGFSTFIFERGGIVTVFFLALILGLAPLGLGSARLWYELPLLCGIALLLIWQGLRLKTAWADGDGGWRLDAIDLAALVFTLYTLVRWLTSPVEYFSRLEALNVVAYATIFFTCRYGIQRRIHGLILLGVLIVVGVGETAFAYYLSQNLLWCPFGVSEHLHQFYAPRWVGTYGCPNHFSSFLVMTSGAALAIGCFSRFSWPIRIVAFYLAAMIMIGIFYSISRGAYVSFIGAVLALTIFGIRNGTLRWWIPATAVCVLLLLCVGAYSLSPAAQSRMDEIAQIVTEGQVTNVRLELANDALTIARDHPLFGTGPATFNYVHPRYQGPHFHFRAVLAHDDYLNTLDDYGLVGLIIALFFIVTVTLAFFGPLDVDHRWQDRVLTATGFTAWTALCIHSFLDFNLHIPANAMTLFALTGLGLRGLKQTTRRSRYNTLSLASIEGGLAWVVIVFGLLYLLQTGRTTISDLIYERALSNTQNVSTYDSIHEANTALSFDPGNVQARIYLGNIYRYRASRETTIEGRVGEGSKALDAYQLAAKENPLDDITQSLLGMTFDIMRRYSEAFFCYKNAIEHQPYDGQFWFALGNHYWERGMLEKAEQAYLMVHMSPHGMQINSESEELRQLLDARGIPPPAPGTNPLLSAPDNEPPATTP